MLKCMNRRRGSPSPWPSCAKRNVAKFILFVAAVMGAICQTGCSGSTTAKASQDAVINVGQFGPSTTNLNLGNVALGDSKTVTLTFTNATNSAVTIMSISVSGPGFAASGIASGTILNPGDFTTLSVTFTPASTGNETGSVTVTSNASTPTITVTLQASGVPAGDHAATLSWDASSSVVDGYFVYRSANGGPFTRLNASVDTGLNYTDSSVVAGQTYTYAVTAINDSGESGFSDPVTATIPSP